MAEDNPSHIFPVPWSVRAMNEHFASNINPGDVFLHNDPYSGGTHLNDIAMVYPSLPMGSRYSFRSCVPIEDDVGGTTPGSISGKNTEIFHDGVRIPILKVASRGKLDNSVLELMFRQHAARANVAAIFCPPGERVRLPNGAYRS